MIDGVTATPGPPTNRSRRPGEPPHPTPPGGANPTGFPFTRWRRHSSDDRPGAQAEVAL